ncbi:hypothetical protein DXU92_11585 [Brachybacterium saurashtrense]|uniref:Uncharacterized protein n=1 Tax=Brachybacterium saurashtrense TaxID=556288 RepID=A0AA93ARX4_9MICO|nr:hypothetical protein DXU92_11585 [Brachybacterium saurashtrense]
MADDIRDCQRPTEQDVDAAASYGEQPSSAAPAQDAALIRVDDHFVGGDADALRHASSRPPA